MQYIRNNMILNMQKKGIRCDNLISAMSTVPRHIFVSEALRYRAYDDISLPIGFGQTISKPSVIGLMVQALGLNGCETVLEIGTGSGYQTALLSHLSSKVVTTERIAGLYERARTILLGNNKRNITMHHTSDFNDTEGTFDAIIVAAGTEVIPNDLINRLSVNGVLVIPIGNSSGHHINKYTRSKGAVINVERIGEAIFVPYLRGECA